MPHAPVVVNQALVSLAGTQYGDAVSSVALVPTSSTQNWNAVSGVNQQIAGRASWAAQITLGQDYNTTALFRYLWEHEGDQGVELVVQPAGGTGPSFTAVVTSLPAPQVGGAADSIATADITLGLAGKPEVTWAPAG